MPLDGINHQMSIFSHVVTIVTSSWLESFISISCGMCVVGNEEIENRALLIFFKKLGLKPTEISTSFPPL